MASCFSIVLGLNKLFYQLLSELHILFQFYSRGLGMRPLFLLHYDLRPDLKLLKSVKCVKFLFLLEGTCIATSGNSINLWKRVER